MYAIGNLEPQGPPLGVLARDHDPLAPLGLDPDAGYRGEAVSISIIVSGVVSSMSGLTSTYSSPSISATNRA